MDRAKQTELIDAAICGDEDAFAELYKAYSPKLRFLIANYVREDPDMADDILQNVFMQLHKKLHMFEGNADFGTWCHRIAINEALQYRRSRQSKRYRATTSFEELGVGEEGEEKEFDPGYVDKSLDWVGDVDKLRACVEELPNQYREVMRKRLQGKELSEIAKEMGLHVGTVKSYAHRGVPKLQRMMLGKGQKMEALETMEATQTEAVNTYQPMRMGRKCKCGCGTDIPMKGWPWARGHGSKDNAAAAKPKVKPPVQQRQVVEEPKEGFNVRLTEAEINRLLLALPVSAKLTAVLAYVRG